MDRVVGISVYVFAALLAVIGGYATIVPPDTPNKKGILLVALCVCCGLLLGAQLYKQVFDDEKESASNIRLEEIWKTLDGLTDAMQRLKPPQDEVAKLGERITAVEAKPGQASLKLKALRLSADIFNYLTALDSPPMPKRESWDRDTDALIRYYQNAVLRYSQQFAGRVIAIRGELAERGLVDKELDMFYERPTNPIGMRIVGERIAALAERLPD